MMRSNTVFHGFPYSSEIISLICAVTRREASVRRLSSFLQCSIGIISGCMERSCPSFTKVGPSSLNISHSFSGLMPWVILYLLITFTISSRRFASAPVSIAISFTFNLLRYQEYNRCG